MIIIDMNQISLANVMMNFHMNKSDELEEDMVRHMILNSIRMNRTMFKEEYGEVVLTYDSRYQWRRDIFPQYKQNRRKGRETDSKDWDKIFGLLNAIKSEFKEILPYKFLEVYGAEADDIIGTLCKEYQDQKTMIVSGDKDFIQLQQYKNVQQYAPIQKQMVGEDIDPKQFLLEQILKGDRSDGVPNILSEDDVFVTGEKQKPMPKKRIEEFSNKSNHTDYIGKNWSRNENLIDLTKIPKVYEDAIINSFRSYKINDRSKLLTYFIENKLKSLMENIGDF